jgi:hypothetical protein
MTLNDHQSEYNSSTYFTDVQLEHWLEQERYSKTSRLVNEGTIIRLKNGLFVAGEKLRNNSPLETFTIANMMYGPSYVSLESALSYYGLIPEYSFEITSINQKKNKRYTTPIGRFSYRVIKREAFSEGVVSKNSFYADNKKAHFLIATPEKALLDKLYLDGPKTDYFNFVLENLRFDDFSKLDLQLLMKWASFYNKTFFRLVVELAEKIKEANNV